MGQDNCKPQPGDLIEIDRLRHKHWALYVGDGYVINLTPVGRQHLKLGIHTVPAFIRKVKKQRLKEVVQNNTWCVNNESDQCHHPLPVEEIICRAKDYIDKYFTYHVFGSNCEHFVKKLRYGEAISDQQRDFVRGEMHLQDTTDDKDYLNPGDLIEIYRPGYQHWALYLGKGYVIHVTFDGGAKSKSASNGSVLTKKGKVKKELLKDVVKNHNWRVNNKYDRSRTPFPVKEIIWRAELCIDREVPYDVLKSNCEHFVTMLRYGEGVSDQAKTALQNINFVYSVMMTGLKFAWVGICRTATAAFPVVNLSILATPPLGFTGGGDVLEDIVFTLDRIARSISSAEFEMAGRDILEQSCC